MTSVSALGNSSNRIGPSGSVNASAFDFTSIGINCLILLFNKVFQPATCTTAALILSSLPGNNSFTIASFQNTLLVESF